jgi:ATP-binding cassette subfamily F protein 3
VSRISIKNVSLNFGLKTLFDGVNLELFDGDKIILVADNGAGKSTLLRAIANQGKPFFEDLIKIKGEIGWLPQSFEGFEDRPVVEHLILASKNQDLALLLDLPSNDPEWMKEFTASGGARILQTYNKLGLDPDYLHRSFFDISSGERVKVYLAGLMHSHSEILLLDEPTNHLDMDGCQMIEKFVRSHRGIAIMVTHDRALINNTGSNICEICPFNHNLVMFKNGYAGYLAQQEIMKQKAEAELHEQKRELAQLRKLKDSLGSADASKKVITAKKKIQDLKDNMVAVPAKRKEPRMEAEWGWVNPQTSLNLTKVGKEPLFANVSMNLGLGDRVVITGPNGTGKTTLFNMIMGKIPATKGNIRINPGARVALLDQEHELLDLDKTPVEVIIESNPKLQTTTSAVQHLRNFGLYFEHDFFSKLKDLSIGCRRKTHLAQVMCKGVDILLLDEPTNHLYFNAIEQMEAQLLKFPGILIAISHDRYFIKKIPTKVLELDKCKWS